MTYFGKLLRKLRLDRDELLFDMANNVQVSSAFLSAVETGRKSAPTSLVDNIIKYYRLSEDQAIELRSAAAQTSKQVRIQIEDASNKHKDLALAFARQFDSMGDDQVESMLKILNAKDRRDR